MFKQTERNYTDDFVWGRTEVSNVEKTEVGKMVINHTDEGVTE